MEQIIYLEPNDDIITVRDRLNLAEAKRVLLVIPPYAEVLRKRVDLRLVQRQAEHLQIEVALVTSDGEIHRAASEIGLSVFGSIEQGQNRRKWRKLADEEDAWAPGRQNEAWDAAAARSGRRASHPWLVIKNVVAWVLFVGVFVAFGVSAVLLVPSAQVTLVPESEALNITMHVALDPNLDQVDVARGRIPGTYVAVEVEGNAQVATTGKKSIPAYNAKGKVVFVNQLGIPISIPRGTAVRTSAFGSVVRYFTTADVTVPGGFGAQAEAPIEASEPGEFANVPANLINEVEGVASISVRVTNPEPTSGGGSREVPAVTQEDRDRVRSQLLQQLLQDAFFEMQNSLEVQQFIPPESLLVSEVVDETYDRFVTEEAAFVLLQMRLTVLGMKVDMQDANTLIYAEMAARVPPDYELIADGLTFKRGEIVLPADANGDILLEVSGEGFMSARFDKHHIRQSIAGESLDEAIRRLTLELPLQVAPQIDISPAWFGRVPWLPLRIGIEVKTQA